MIEEERLLTVREVAELLSVHINTVKRLPTDELPFYRIVKRGDRRYRPSDVRLYINRREQI